MPRSAADIQATLNKFYAARDAIALGQSYTLDTGQGRLSMTRANLAELENSINNLEQQLEEIEAGTSPQINFHRYNS
jgi:hypothetical protein